MLADESVQIQGFKKYFSLEEAASLLPEIKDKLRQAQQELSALQDLLILQKRLLLVKQENGRRPKDEEVALLHEKFEAYEAVVQTWVDSFAEQGIILRDIHVGLIDFPYYAHSTQQDYFLCWRPPEDGVFYFHGIHEGFAGRHPITLLPD